MAGPSNIEWCTDTWNPIVGCSIVSPGCTNCYAMRWAHSGMKSVKHYQGTTRSVNGKPVWTGKVAEAPEHILTAPLRWKKPRRIFVNSMGDLFHEDCPDDWIDNVFAVMLLAKHHTFQVLTKRAKRMREYVTRYHRNNSGANPKIANPLDQLVDEAWAHLFLPNVWLGVSCEDQARADERIPDLLATPAAVSFVSAEPLLGPIDFTNGCNGHYFFDALRGTRWHDDPERSNPAEKFAPGLDWVIAGGESGPGARPLDMGWARSIVRQCQAAGVRCFVKQLGPQPYETMGSTMRHDDPNDIFGTMEKAIANPPPKGWTRVHYGSETRLYRYHRLKDRKGGDMIEWPEDLRVREMP